MTRSSSQSGIKGCWPVFSGVQSEFENAKDSLESFSFSTLEYSDDDLTVLICELFRQVKNWESTKAAFFLTEFLLVPQLAAKHEICVSIASLKTFILAVRAGMPNNPYHNWKHVVDVTQVNPLKAQTTVPGLFTMVRRHALSTDGLHAGEGRGPLDAPISQPAPGAAARRPLPRLRAPGRLRRVPPQGQVAPRLVVPRRSGPAREAPQYPLLRAAHMQARRPPLPPANHRPHRGPPPLASPPVPLFTSH